VEIAIERRSESSPLCSSSRRKRFSQLSFSRAVFSLEILSRALLPSPRSIETFGSSPRGPDNGRADRPDSRLVLAPSNSRCLPPPARACSPFFPENLASDFDKRKRKVERSGSSLRVEFRSPAADRTGSYAPPASPRPPRPSDFKPTFFFQKSLDAA